jgi:hypothetical protein
MSENPLPALVKPFWPALPRQPTNDQLVYCQTLIITDPRFETIVARLPRAEVTRLLSLVKEPPTCDVRAAIAYNRITNRICNFCHDKSDTSLLLACGGCQMTYYCGKICQYNDWHHNVPSLTKHREWCCQLGAQADNGPNQMAILQLDKSE